MVQGSKTAPGANQGFKTFSLVKTGSTQWLYRDGVTSGSIGPDSGFAAFWTGFCSRINSLRVHKSRNNFLTAKEAGPYN